MSGGGSQTSVFFKDFSDSSSEQHDVRNSLVRRQQVCVRARVCVCVCVCVCMCVCVRFSTLGFMLESPRELKIFFSWAATSRDSDLIASWWTGGGGLLFALPRQL